MVGNEHHESLLEEIGRKCSEELISPDFLIKKYGTRFKHMKSTNLSQYVDRLCEWIFQNNPRYIGSLEAIGSEAEGIHVNTSDYDFLLVSDAPALQQEKLEIQPAEMPSFRADSKSEKNLLKSYFKVFFKDDVPGEWVDCTETGSKSLNARLVQRAFAKALADTVISGTEHNSSDRPTFTVLNNDDTVTLNGPAVSFIVIDRTNGEPKKMDTDITFAIPLNLTDSKDFWPLDGQFPGVELTDHVKAGQPIKAVHLIPAGDYWRLSFVLEERERMKELLLDENKHTCMVALKAMRNSVSQTHDDESPLLSSYPLKWSFMMETQDTEDEEWQENTLGEHTVSILDRVVQCGSTGSMSSYFLKGDPVLKDSDRSYLEIRRIKKPIEDDNRMSLYLFGFYYILISISTISFLFYSTFFIYHFIIIDFFECAEPSTEADLYPVWSNLTPMLPGFIRYAIVASVVAFRVSAHFQIHAKIFVVAGTLSSCLLQPILILAISISNGMNISEDTIGLQICLELVLLVAFFIHISVILTFTIYGAAHSHGDYLGLYVPCVIACVLLLNNMKGTSLAAQTISSFPSLWA